MEFTNYLIDQCLVEKRLDLAAKHGRAWEILGALKTHMESRLGRILNLCFEAHLFLRANCESERVEGQVRSEKLYIFYL
jgi:hypothetical protein